jgi:hypothetical protein
MAEREIFCGLLVLVSYDSKGCTIRTVDNPYIVATGINRAYAEDEFKRQYRGAYPG